MCKEFSPTEDRWVYGELRKFDGPGPSEHNATRTALQPPRFPILVMQWPLPAGVRKASRDR